MHTTKVMSTNDFDFMINGDKGSLEDLFPGFNVQDRLGIVVRQPGGSAGASALLMAAVTRFYDFYRPWLADEPDKLRIYPEFFIFHVGKKHMDHYWMDVWTPNKEVIVEDDPEQILEAINDRGITRLLVEDITPSPATFLHETISSAEHRIVSALAYSPTGRVHHGDVSITSCSAAERFVFASFKRSRKLLKKTYEELQREREALIVNGRVIETYRRIEIANAIQMLTYSTGPGPTTSHYISML
ncbi:hypothetical protein PB1_03815 [Bacillus methanolicus PB1]|uniref:Uncharacterized protein n=1 Tax=Bacillus methanolicus PB1 TaxID=997296 RepID=I3E6B3_BACMT|nr:hypothetical protein [Bacillus methanolicus]EIJ82034.1 hypothetical protein PB1_03815 [Bacillus methanolicus PB1]